MSLATLHSSDRQDWRTPEHLLDLVRGVADIGLDPCASSDPAHHFARVNVTQAEDGLSVDWGALIGPHELAYVNPEYGRALPSWVGKWADEPVESVLLAPARTDTRWFRDATAACSARCLWYGRLTFRGAAAGAPFPSALWYRGPHPFLFCDVFHHSGEVQVFRGEW